ncbi:hypothetical protein C8R46DRAFT_1361725 [Mycena filopes]|nr:hypothetical protein C8R46DRAFT_1361725 [Mycena filopes]
MHPNPPPTRSVLQVPLTSADPNTQAVLQQRGSSRRKSDLDQPRSSTSSSCPRSHRPRHRLMDSVHYGNGQLHRRPRARTNATEAGLQLMAVPASTPPFLTFLSTIPTGAVFTATSTVPLRVSTLLIPAIFGAALALRRASSSPRAPEDPSPRVDIITHYRLLPRAPVLQLLSGTPNLVDSEQDLACSPAAFPAHDDEDATFALPHTSAACAAFLTLLAAAPRSLPHRRLGSTQLPRAHTLIPECGSCALFSFVEGKEEVLPVPALPLLSSHVSTFGGAGQFPHPSPLTHMHCFAVRNGHGGHGTASGGTRAACSHQRDPQGERRVLAINPPECMRSFNATRGRTWRVYTIITRTL